MHVSTGTILHTFSLNGTLMSSQKGAGSKEHFSSCSSRGTFSTTHLCTSLHSFLTTLVHTFSSTCLLTLRITHRHFFTSSGAHTLVGVTLVTLLQTLFGTLAHTSSFFHSITSFASTLQTFSTFFRATSRHLLLSPSVLLLLSSSLSCPL